MPYKPFLKEVNYLEDSDRVNLVVEHRNGTQTIIRQYTFDLPITLAAAKNHIKAANTALREKPNVMTNLEALIDSEIT